jgi:hypothetical protein
MTSPDPTFRRLPGWQDQSTWQFLLLLVVIGASAWLVSHMREVVNPSPVSETRKDKLVKADDEAKPEVEEVPKPRARPFIGFDESRKTLPDAARESFHEACAVLRRAITPGSTGLLEDCVRHPAVTMPRARTMPLSRAAMPSFPLSIGPGFGITGDLLLTTVRLLDGTERPAVLEKTAEGYKLDWESFNGWCETDFDGLQTHVGMKVHPRLMRVNCQPTSGRAPFSEEKGISLVITHPAEKEALNTFVSETVLQRTTAGAELKSSKGGPFTLYIQPDRDTIKHGWVRVDEVICSGWVTDR